MGKECADDVTAAWPLFQGESGGATPTSALDFYIATIDVRLAQRLNKLWHSRLPDTDFDNLIRTRRLDCFAAEFAGKYYATAIWTSPIARNLNYDTTLELRRMADGPDFPKNAASRMLAVMRRILKRKYPEIQKFISYQDTAVHKGTIYKADGWVLENVSRDGDEWNRPLRRRAAKAQSTAAKARWSHAA